jgi:chromosome segregation ATPase
MKNPLLRGLQAVGLAPVGHLYEARAHVSAHELAIRELRGKVEQMSREITASRDEAARLRTTSEQAEQRHAAARDEFEKALRESRGAATHWKAKAEELLTQVRELRGRLADAERVEAQLRELMMANETKLDLVEAAINVLDHRTRREAAGSA